MDGQFGVAPPAAADKQAPPPALEPREELGDVPGRGRRVESKTRGAADVERLTTPSSTSE